MLIVESQQIPSDLAESTVQTNAGEQLQIIQQRILTRARLIDMARDLGVYDARGDAPAQRLPTDEMVRDMRDRISIDTDGGRDQATIVRVSFRAPTAQLSADVTNEIVTQLLAENVQIRTGVAGQTLQYFVDEVARLDLELATRGAEILTFQEENLNSLPDSLEFRRTQQAAAQERLLQFDREAATLNDRRANLVALFESTGQVGVAPATNLTPEARQLQSLRDELSGLLAVLSPENPRVRVMQAQVTALEQTVAAQAGNAPLEPGGAAPSAYEIQLADIDAQLAFIAEQQVQVRETMDLLRQSIEETPGNAITLDTLQRDYDAVREQYDQAIANRARAETGDTIEALAKGQRISIIEQAITPRAPQSPNRTMLAAGGIGGGFILGLALIVLIEFMGSAIRRPVDISSRLGITPLGTVPLMRTRWEIVRRRAIIALVFAIVLIAVPVGLWFVDTQVMPLDQVIGAVLKKLGFG